MRYFIVRHGTSEGNVNPQVYFEQKDHVIKLAPKGKADAINAADFICNFLHDEHMAQPYPQTERVVLNVIHSTYKRATQTAEYIKEAIEYVDGYTVENMIPSPLAREREWGELRDVLNSKRQTPDHFNFYYTPPEGESFADVYTRAALFNQWLKGITKYKDNVIVAHGEFNKVLLMHLLNWDVDEFHKWGHQRNGEVWIVEDGKLHSITPIRKSRYF